MVHRSDAGFTVIELMVTVAVLAILLAVAVPSFNEFFQKARVRGAADDVVSLVALARGEAVKIGRPVSVSVGGTTSAWCVGANAAAVPALTEQVAASANCDCTTNGACMVDGLERVVASAEHAGTTVSAVGSQFVIDGVLGSATGLAGTSVDFASPSGEFALRVVVSPLAQARACVPAGKPAISGYRSC